MVEINRSESKKSYAAFRDQLLAVLYTDMVLYVREVYVKRCILVKCNDELNYNKDNWLVQKLVELNACLEGCTIETAQQMFIKQVSEATIKMVKESEFPVELKVHSRIPSTSIMVYDMAFPDS